MKIRNGFVSNSSSSSFIIAKTFLTNEQEEKIKNWVSVDEDEKEENEEYLVRFYENESYIYSNNNMIYYYEEFNKFLESMGVDRKNVLYTEG